MIMERRIKVLAVASGGGHWIELMRIMPAFAGAHVVFATVNRDYARDVSASRFYVVPDATRWSKAAAMWQALRILMIVLRERPNVVISTGAAPGYFAVRFGRWVGARTIWLDSIANVEELSMSGRLAGPHADLWLTQWPHLAGAEGRPAYAGAVL